MRGILHERDSVPVCTCFSRELFRLHSEQKYAMIEFYTYPGLPLLLLDFLYAPNLSIDQPYLDPMWVRSGVGQNVLDDSSGQFSCSLVLLEDD